MKQTHEDLRGPFQEKFRQVLYLWRFSVLSMHCLNEPLPDKHARDATMMALIVHD